MSWFSVPFFSHFAAHTLPVTLAVGFQFQIILDQLYDIVDGNVAAVHAQVVVDRVAPFAACMVVVVIGAGFVRVIHYFFDVLFRHAVFLHV